MSFENRERQEQNQTASFHYIEKASESEIQRQPLSPIQQRSEDDNPHNESIAMPQPLIQNKVPISQEHQFQPQGKPKQQQLNMTFYPQSYKMHIYDQNSLQALRVDNSRLKLHMIGLNDMISEMIVNKNEVLNEYQSVVMQKKCYKKLMKNLNEQYESYQTMLQGDYQIKLDQQIQIQSKRLTQLKKQVQAMNSELSKPKIKDSYQNDLKIQRLQKEIFEGQVYLQKMKSANQKNKEKIIEMQARIKQKQGAIKKMEFKINKYQQQCDDDDLLPKEQQQAMKRQYQELMGRFQRFKKIIELDEKKRESELSRKRKGIKEKCIVVKNMDRQIKDYETKIQGQFNFLQLNSQKNKRKQLQILQKTSVPSLRRSQTNSNQSHFSREAQVSTPKTHSDLVGNKFERQGPTVPTKLYESFNGKPAPNIDNEQRFGHYRTVTEGSELNSRLQLNLRKKKIYTQLQKNQYFKKIENNEQIKLSRLIEATQPPLGTLRELQNQLETQTRHKTKLPQINSKFSRKIETAPGDDSQPLLNDSIIDQIKLASIDHSRKQPKRSIELHNYYMKQLRANKKKLNLANYQQLCRTLNRQKLLIEQDCGYELGELIYNSRF